MSLEDQLYPWLRIYDRSPRWVRAVSGAVYRSLPDALRLGRRFKEFQRLSQEFESASRSEIEVWQVAMLRDTLRYASNHCAYYREKFRAAKFDPACIASRQDIRTCPMLEKRDIQENLGKLASDEFSAKSRLYVTTGGSTGVPVGFYLQKGVSRPKEQAYLEAMWARAEFKHGARLVVIRAYVGTAGRIDSYDAARDWLLLSSAHLATSRAPEYLQLIEKFEPEFIHAYPSAILQLAEFLTANKHTWRQPLRGILCGSEWMSESQKKLVEHVFGCRVYRWYGHSERVVMAGEGAKSPLFYFFPTYGYVEFGPPDSGGLCEVIGTSFHNRVMPLIRYRTGDYVRVAAGAAEFPWPAISEIAGRGQEEIVCADGRRVSLTAFNMHDSIFDNLYAVQFYQEQPGSAEFRYIPGPRFDKANLDRIRSRILEKLGAGFDVHLKPVADVEKTAGGKHRWLISKLT